MVWKTRTLAKVSGTTLSSGVLDSAVVYNVKGVDEVSIQLDATWPPGLRVAVEISLDGSHFKDFPDGALEFTAAIAMQNLNVQNWTHLRLRVSNAAGATTVTPTARGKR